MIKVIGIGDNVVDKYEHIRTMYPGGNALNFAACARRLGIESAFLGAFGSDKEGQHAAESARAMGIDISHCKYYEGENGSARVNLVNGDRIFLGSNQCGVLRTVGLNLAEEDYKYLEQFDLIHSGLYGFAEKELKQLKEMGKTISYDFSDNFTEEKLEEMLSVVDYAFFSASGLSMAAMCNLMLRGIKKGCRFVLCTRGFEGAFLYDGYKFYQQEPHLVDAVDTMAAGDSFITCLMVHYLGSIRSGETEENAMKKGLEEAAEFSAGQCLISGSFGYGKTY